LIVPKRRYIKVHVVGGSGIFDTLSNFVKRIISSNAAKSVASTIANAASTDIGKTAIAAAKAAGKELAKTGINAAKDVIAKGKQLIDRGSKKILTPQNVATIQQLTGLTPNVPVITQQSKDILAGIANAGAAAAETNINKILGSGTQRNVRAQNVIAIQDLVKRMNDMNGSGLRLAPG
jgi:hypothetical protein